MRKAFMMAAVTTALVLAPAAANAVPVPQTVHGCVCVGSELPPHI